MKVAQHISRRKLLLACSAVLLFVPIAAAQKAPEPKRVLAIYWDNKDFRGNVIFDEQFQKVLKSAPFPNLEYYPEYLESSRFPGDDHVEAFYEYLKRKYDDRHIDVILAIPDTPLNFVLKYRKDLFPDTPIVFNATKPPGEAEYAVTRDMTGIVVQTTHRETLDLALKLHPDTQQLFVISGSLEHDHRYEATARQELAPYENRVHITYLTDLPLNELITTTQKLPPRSIGLYVWQKTRDDQGRILETFEVLQRFAPTASVPLYGLGSGNVGMGLVGGYVQGPDGNGKRVGEMVVRILNGERAQDIAIEPAPNGPMFDWRQLQRWAIDESRLPAGSVVRFREFSFWELYKWRIVGVIALFALQTMFIGVLLVERRRRKRARELLAQLNAELEERIAARTAALDAKTRELEAFAYSVAHDLKAPLRGIDGYSRLLLEDHKDQLDDEGRSFLNTIQASADEMSQLIQDLLDYSRLERRELNPHRLELQPLVKAVVEQKQHEIVDRDIDFRVNVNGGYVMADANGLSQALKNYIDNAVKFTRDVSAPLVEVGSRETPGGCLLWVRDNGIGFDMKYHDRIFNIFQRLNHSEDYPGTGIGLAIVRKAMERLGGRAWAESEPGRGATFYLEIPQGTVAK
ncbi:MAG TPA: ABC transporter substrate binding protein [Pyrinomonadaceae bacterium]|nr:ABC transporter substrate binding protein [Pyrinomonadaceae bacterium]